MSLVNDMLKDLDARRRGSPVNGNAARKLTPASERSGFSQSSRLPLVAAIAGGVVGVAVVLWLLLIDRENTGELADLRSTGTESRLNSATGSVPASTATYDDQPAAVNNDGATARGESVAAAEESEAATIAALEARLAELEAANNTSGALNVPDNPARPSDWEPVDWSVNPNVAADSNTVANTITDANLATGANTDINMGARPAVEPSPPLATATPQQSAPVETVERQAREMPLVERDRLKVQDALTLWSQGQQLSALQTLDAFAYENPEAHQSRETLAKLLIRQGETERALQAAELGLQIAPSHPGYKKVKARILIGQSNIPAALVLLSATPPSVGNDPEYHNLLATVQLAGGEYTQAIQSYRALLRLDDPRIDKAPLWYGLGSSQQRLGNMAEARQAYQQALQQPTLSANLRAEIERRLAAPVAAQ